MPDQVIENLVDRHAFLLRRAESLDSLFVVLGLPDFPLQELRRMLLVRFPCALAVLLSAKPVLAPPKLTAWMLLQSAVTPHFASPPWLSPDALYQPVVGLGCG